MSNATLLLLALLYCHATFGSKQRQWLDSALTLLEGSLPSPRYGHRLAGTDDGKIYAFGGIGLNGELGDPCATLRTGLLKRSTCSVLFGAKLG